MGEDRFRARLRLAELVTALSTGAPTERGDLAAWSEPILGPLVGVTRHQKRADGTLDLEAILLSGRSQGLFDAPDERRVVVVEDAEAIRDPSFVGQFPEDSALVMLTLERLPARGRRARPRKEAGGRIPEVDLAGAVEATGGRVERIARLLPERLPEWIASRARLRAVRLEPAAAGELATAVGADTDRIEQELAKLATYARGEPVTVADVRALVAGAIETDVFELTRAVVRRDARNAVDRLERLLDEGQAPGQILALLLWQFRVLLFASAMKGYADAEKAARAIRSSAGAIARWQGEAKRLSRADIVRAYEALYATDLAIKQGRTDEATALMLCVLDLCGVAGADVRDLVVGEPPRR